MRGDSLAEVEPRTDHQIRSDNEHLDLCAVSAHIERNLWEPVPSSCVDISESRQTNGAIRFRRRALRRTHDRSGEMERMVATPGHAPVVG